MAVIPMSDRELTRLGADRWDGWTADDCGGRGLTSGGLSCARYATGHQAHLTRRRKPDRHSGQHAACYRQQKDQPVITGKIVQDTGHPGPGGATTDQGAREGPKNGTIVRPLENLRDNRP